MAKPAKPLEGAYDPTAGNLLDDILLTTRNRRSAAQNAHESPSKGSNIESKPESKPESNIESLQESLQESQSASLQADRLTGQTADRLTSQPTNQPTNQPAYQSDGRPTNQPTALPDDQSAYQIAVNQQTGLSMRERLLLEARGKVPEAKPLLKAVTLKLDPTLDRRIEEHCHASGKKKQDVIADALALYFETLEGA